MDVTVYKCKWCSKEYISIRSLIGHQPRCKSNPKYEINIKNSNNFNKSNTIRKIDIKQDCYCKYCNKVCTSLNSLKQHEVRCKSNPNAIDVKSYIKPGHSKGHKGANHYIKAEQLGLPKPEISEETRKKLSEKSKGRKLSDVDKQKISEAMKIIAKEKPDVYCGQHTNGRVKKYLYNGVHLDGTWELKVAKYLDEQGIRWERPRIPFNYIWKNSDHFYYPDFYLPDYDYYIEVKGYETERDLIKYKTIEDKLILIKKEEINCILNGTYSILNYIKS